MNQEQEKEIQLAAELAKSYDTITRELQELLDSGDEAKLTAYTKARVEALTQSSKPKELSLLNKQPYDNFIHPESSIRRSLFVEGFHLDDNSIYQAFLDELKQFRQNEQWRQRPLREAAFTALQRSLVDYFGNIAAGSNTEMDNREFYLDRSTVGQPDISISELKGKGFAVCAEKAAVAHNLTKFLGLKSSLVFSSRCKIPAEGQEEAHVYQLLEGERGRFVYDPTNPKFIEDPQGKILNYTPAIYPITTEQEVALRTGKVVEITHEDLETSDGGQTYNKKHSQRVYAGA